MAETQKSTMPQSVIENLSKLTEKERKYFAVMWAKYGVLNITSKPGVAKSAIGKSIADKMNFRYMDIRLSMVDETDVGLYPSINEDKRCVCAITTARTHAKQNWRELHRVRKKRTASITWQRYSKTDACVMNRQVIQRG